jgi:hypothetical protein
MKKFILVIFLITASLNVLANQVEKNDWINHIKNSMPAYFCQSNQVFRQCFSVSANDCLDVAYSAINVCLRNMDKKIPKKIKIPEEGQKLGGDIGECAATTYGAVLSDKRIKSEQCNKLIFGR